MRRPHSVAVLVLVGLVSWLASAAAERMSRLDNGTIRIGADLDVGGTITGLRLDPPDANGPHDEIRLESISGKPE